MKDKLRRIDPLIRRAEERKQTVAREFAARNRALTTQEERLGELLRYRDEYAQWQQGSRFDPAQLANREAFRHRLADAVVTQQKFVEQCRTMAELERVRLGIASRERKVVDALADQYREEQRRWELTHEQKTQDEHANAQFSRRCFREEDDT